MMARWGSVIACAMLALIARLAASEPNGFNEDKLSNSDRAFFASKAANFWRADDQETSLRQVLFIHRHGDRTPIEQWPKDPLAKEPFWNFHGLGQLTNRGKARLSLLGKIMRLRYDSFLGGSIHKDQRKSRSSGGLRCIESAQVFLASFLGLDSSHNNVSRRLVWADSPLARAWQPASVTTLAAKYDGMLYEGAACKTLDREYANFDRSSLNERTSEEFAAESQLLEQVLGFKTDHYYKWFWVSSLLEIERSYFPGRLDGRLEAAYPRVEEASDRSLMLYQSTLTSRRLRAGLLIGDMIDNMHTFRETALAGSPSGPFNKKFVHYSAHDINLVVLLGMLDLFQSFPFRPDYAANIIMELHEDQQAREWFVKFFYMHHVPSQPIELHVAECERGHPKRRCTLDQFDRMMGKYKIDSWQTWMSECGNDLSSVNPYAQNT